MAVGQATGGPDTPKMGVRLVEQDQLGVRTCGRNGREGTGVEQRPDCSDLGGIGAQG